MNKIFWKFIHNWSGLASALFLVILLATGILLNHPAILKRNETDSMALDPSNPKRILRGRGDGLFESKDGGVSWEEVPMLYAPQEVSDIVFSPSDAASVYVLERWGQIFSSHDGGRIWEKIALPFDAQAKGIELMKISAGTRGHLVLLTSNGWLSSEDSGKSWKTSHFHADKMPLRRLILSLHNGYFFGPSFHWVYDFSALALLVLIVTGIALWRLGKKGL